MPENLRGIFTHTVLSVSVLISKIPLERRQPFSDWSNRSDVCADLKWEFLSVDHAYKNYRILRARTLLCAANSAL